MEKSSGSNLESLRIYYDVRFITFTDAIFDSLNSKIQQF